MPDILYKYIPENAVELVIDLMNQHNVHLKIVKERVTRHGDYRKLENGQHQITINANLNLYRFLITLIHEIAHLVVFQEEGRRVKPHGKEWKHVFQQLMLPFIRPEIFPDKLLPLLALHFKNPKATSDTDTKLSLALKAYDLTNDKNYIFEIPYGGHFKLYNGKIFKRGNIRVKRYECVELKTGKMYLFNPNAEVEYLKSRDE